MAEKPAPGESAWAELRETQTKTLGRVPNTGQAVIIDIGEGRDIHPRNKYDVASRLVRWALVKDYGLKFPYRSPEYKSVKIADGKATVTLDCFGSTLRAFDVTEARGFAICGEDKVWKWASAKIVGNDQVEVSHPEIPNPIAVRYAWADNPVCNLFSADGLPVTPFRTDDFEMTTKPKPPAPKPAPAPPQPPNVVQTTFRNEALARIQRASIAECGFTERLVMFWSNHFCISATKGEPARIWAGSFEREAIRPHVLGRFGDMLKAVEQHPAMLFFLDNQQSIGPDSRAGQNRKRGLNENLAREIMELHTLGVGSGYSQTDVTTLAAIITGSVVTSV
eukprot:gene6986-9414_t